MRRSRTEYSSVGGQYKQKMVFKITSFFLLFLNTIRHQERHMQYANVHCTDRKPCLINNIFLPSYTVPRTIIKLSGMKNEMRRITVMWWVYLGYFESLHLQYIVRLTNKESKYIPHRNTVRRHQQTSTYHRKIFSRSLTLGGNIFMKILALSFSFVSKL